MDDFGILKGRNSICTFLEISKAVFYQLVDQGLPVKKVGKFWYGHQDVLKNWFRDFVKLSESRSSDQSDQ